jgi:protein TonB
MAFEAVLSQEKLAPRKWRRATLTLSLILHVSALIVGVAYSFWRVDELPLPSVAVTLASGAPPPPPPPPPAAARKKASTTTPKTKPVVQQPKPDTLVQPKEQPKEEPKPQPAEEKSDKDEPGEVGGVAGGVAGGVKGGVTGGVVGGVVGAPLPKNTAPKLVPAEILMQQLIINPQDERYKVTLPPSLNRPGIRFKAVVMICISAQGTVTSVRVLRGADPAIDSQIPVVLKRWLYRPFMVNGHPEPACTKPFTYDVSAR